jgi:hypothetical protein
MRARCRCERFDPRWAIRHPWWRRTTRTRRQLYTGAELQAQEGSYPLRRGQSIDRVQLLPWSGILLALREVEGWLVECKAQDSLGMDGRESDCDRAPPECPYR